MKITSIIFIIILNMTSIKAQTTFDLSKFITDSKHKVDEIQKLVDEVGMNKVGSLYFQKLKEIEATLTQFKANSNNLDIEKSQVNTLQASIAKIVYPQIKTPSLSKVQVQNKLIGNGKIRGMVFDQLTGVPFNSGGNVLLYDSLGNYLLSSNIDTQGRYLFTDLAVGNYIVLMKPRIYSNYLDTLYPNIACLGGLGAGCQLSDAQTIALSQGEILENIDINVISKATISGKVVDDLNNPIQSTLIELYENGNTNQLSYVYTDNAGKYSLVVPSDGDYFVTATKNSYQKMLYNNIICSETCDFNFGLMLDIVNGQGLNNIDFSLVTVATISGLVVESQTSSSVNNATIRVINLVENTIVGQITTGQTNIWSIGLPTGSYTIDSSAEGYLATRFDSIPCDSQSIYSCDNVPGNTINHTTSNLENVILNLEKGATIAGRVFDNFSNVISGVRVSLYRTNGSIYSITYSKGDGTYTFSGVNNGDYYVKTNSYTHSDEIYPNVVCDANNCDLSQGLIINVNNFNDVLNVDFFLDSYSTISGKILDANGLPVNDAYVRAVEINTNKVGFAQSDGNGKYSFNKLATGSYRVYVETRYTDVFVSQIYNGIDCDDFQCNGESFSTINVDESNITSIDFNLTNKGSVQFNFTSNSSNPVNSGEILIYKEDGSFYKRGYINNSTMVVNVIGGNYYFFYTNNTFRAGHVPKIYGGSNCPDNNCDVTTGTKISIANESSVTLNMSIDEHFYIDFIPTTVDGNEGVYNSDLSPYNDGYVYSMPNRKYIADGGGKYIRIGKEGFYPQIYDGIECYGVTCDLTQGTLIQPQLNDNLIIAYTLNSISSLSGKVTDNNGLPLTNVNVGLYRNINSYGPIKTVKSDEFGNYLIDAIPIDEYYLKATTDLEMFAPTFYGNISCETINCASVTIPKVNLNPGDNLQSLNIQLQKKGSISGERVLNTNQLAIPAKIDFYKINIGSINLIKTIEISNDGTFPSVYLANGSYQMIARENVYEPAHSSFPSSVCDGYYYASCARDSQVINVVADQDTHINGFTVHENGTIEVIIRDSISDELLTNMRLDLKKIGSNYLKNIYLNNNQFIGKFKNGDYRLFISPSSNQSEYISQLYNQIECVDGIGYGCSWSQGATINVTYDTQRTVNVYMTPKPRIKITLMDEVTNMTLVSQVKLIDMNDNIVYSQSSNTNNPSHLVKWIDAGLYYIIAKRYSDYQIKAYPDAICTNDSSISSCNGSIMTVELKNGEPMQNITIDSVFLAGVNGYVRDDITGEPISDVIIDFWDQFGSYINSTKTLSNGAFQQRTNTGSTYVSTDVKNEYTNEIYNDITCNNAAIIGDCIITQGELLDIPRGNSTPVLINLDLNNVARVFVNGFE